MQGPDERARSFLERRQAGSKRHAPLDFEYREAARLCAKNTRTPLNPGEVEGLRLLGGAAGVRSGGVWSPAQQCNAFASAGGARWSEAYEQDLHEYDSSLASRQQQETSRALLASLAAQRARRRRLLLPATPSTIQLYEQIPPMTEAEYEATVPLDIQYGIMRQLVTNNLPSAYNLALASNAQARLFESVAEPIVQRSIVKRTDSNVSATSAIMRGAELSTQLGGGASIKEAQLAGVLCVLEALARFMAHQTARVYGYRRYASNGTPEAWEEIEPVTERLAQLPLADRVRVWYEWLQSLTLGCYLAGTQNTGLVPGWDLVAWYGRLIRALPEGSAESKYASWEPLFYMEYDELAEGVPGLVTPVDAESLLTWEPGDEVIKHLESPAAAAVVCDFINAGVSASMVGPCADAARSQSIIMPRFSDIFPGPIQLVRGQSYMWVLVDMRSPLIESLLGQ